MKPEMPIVTTRRSNFSVTLFSLGVFAFTRCVLADPYTAEDLLNQARIPFAEKFERVIQNQSISQVSELNLTRLSRILPIPSARSNAGDLGLTGLEIAHETGIENALRILDSGAFYSLDELVRRGILPPSAKADRASKPDLDGEIGEQDVVFLSIREKGGFSQSYKFGEVTFTFEPAVLERGYFTYYPFGVGSKQLSKSRSPGVPEKGQSDELLRAGLPLYSSQIFAGRKALSKVLDIMDFQDASICGKARSIKKSTWHTSPVFDQSEWKDEHEYRQFGLPAFSTFLNSLLTKVPPYAEYNATHRTGWKPYDSRELLRAIACLPNLNYEKEAGKAGLTLSQYREAGMANGRSPIWRKLGGYRFLPVDVDGDSLFFTTYAGFWELKVPTSLPVSFVRKIDIVRAPARFGLREVEKMRKGGEVVYSDLRKFKAAEKRIETSMRRLAAILGRGLLKTETEERLELQIL